MNSLSLDGKYRITSTSSYAGPLEQRSDGMTEIRDGETTRFDENGVLWNSLFRVVSDNEVEMVSTADPAEAKPDFALTRPDGSPTREPVTYRGMLKLSRRGNDIQMSGRIEYGKDIIILTLRKIGD